MCTVSIITLGDLGGYRLVTNRDEQRTRTAGEPPAWRRFGAVEALAPLDPDSGGTWIATNRSGLSLCILNGNLEPSPPAPASPRSRGLIIPTLIGSASADDALNDLKRSSLDSYAPFRLVIVQPADSATPACRVADAFWNGRTLDIAALHAVPACFVSSGLGDSLVTPRVTLFGSTVGKKPTPAAQDEFHHHAWSDRPEISVCMSRADARTVSITTVTIEPNPDALPRIRSAHLRVPERDPGMPIGLALASGTRSG